MEDQVPQQIDAKDHGKIFKKLFYIKKLFCKSLKKFNFKDLDTNTLKVYQIWKSKLQMSLPEEQLTEIEGEVEEDKLSRALLSETVKETMEKCTKSISSLVSSLKKLRDARARKFKKVYPAKKKKIIKENSKEKLQKLQRDQQLEDRKNRPGQRARRLKWEKKYGKEANHVKKIIELQIKEKEKEKKREAVHPSWDAKKREKEAQERILKSRKKPTKIVFQD